MNNVTFDVECTSLPYIFPWQEESQLVCLSTCDDAGERRTWFFTTNAATKSQAQCIEEIQEYLNRYDRLIAHNLKFDLHWLMELGINTDKHVLWCTMVVEYLIRGHEKLQGLSLDALASYYGAPPKKDLVKMYWDAGVDTPDIDPKLLQTYCEQDAVTTMNIFKKQTGRVNRLGLAKLVSLDMGALRCYQEMEWNGMQLDMKLIETHRKAYADTLNDMDTRLVRLLGIPNPGSNRQLSVALYGGTYKIDGRVPGAREGTTKNGKVPVKMKGLGFDPTSLGIAESAVDGFYSVDKNMLALLKPKTAKQKEVVAILEERSKTAQLLSTFLEALPKLAINGIVHGNINQALTKTGRISCSKPNLTNQPRGNNGPVKSCFVSRYGSDGLILDVDLAQIEWRVEADLTQDPVMMQEIACGRDQHAYTCVHHMERELTKQNRTEAKIFNFRAIYIDPKVAPFAYFMDTTMPSFSKKKWQAVVDGFFDHYNVMASAHLAWIDEVNLNGQIVGKTGRIWKFHKEEKKYWAYNGNKIRNYPVQGSAGDLLKLAMVYIRRRVTQVYPAVKMCIAVHDSVIFDLPKELALPVAKICIEVFELLPQLAEEHFNWKISVPITGDAKAGPSWGTAEDLTI